jgi:NitT/TauT family transport system substrate-binding protein
MVGGTAMTTTARRDFLRGAGAVLAGAAVGAPAPARAAEPIKVTWQLLASGINAVFASYLLAKRFDREQGIELVTTQTYVDVGTYYNDFLAGRSDVQFGSWDTYAARYLAGVPIRLIATLTPADIVGIMVRADGPKTVADLRGKAVAAPKATGTYRLTTAFLKRFHGLELEADAQVQNVPSPATSITYLLANRADAALSWEPNLSIGLGRQPTARILYNLGGDYRAKTGDTLWFFGVAAQKSLLDRHPTIDQRIVAAYRRTAEELSRNLDEALAIAAKTVEMDRTALRLAFDSGRTRFTPESMKDARPVLRRQADFLAEGRVFERKVDDAFFYSSI